MRAANPIIHLSKSSTRPSLRPRLPLVAGDESRFARKSSLMASGAIYTPVRRRQPRWGDFSRIFFRPSQRHQKRPLAMPRPLFHSAVRAADSGFGVASHQVAGLYLYIAISATAPHDSPGFPGVKSAERFSLPAFAHRGFPQRLDILLRHFRVSNRGELSSFTSRARRRTYAGRQARFERMGLGGCSARVAPWVYGLVDLGAAHRTALASTRRTLPS